MIWEIIFEDNCVWKEGIVFFFILFIISVLIWFGFNSKLFMCFLFIGAVLEKLKASESFKSRRENNRGCFIFSVVFRDGNNKSVPFVCPLFPFLLSPPLKS